MKIEFVRRAVHGKHLPSGKLVLGAVYSSARLLCLINRVCPPQEVLRTAYGGGPCGKHKLCEHLPSARLTDSGAFGDKTSHIPIIRVQRRVQF